MKYDDELRKKWNDDAFEHISVTSSEKYVKVVFYLKKRL